MDTALSKRDRSYMPYWYFVDFCHSIWYLPIFLTVLGTPQCPLLYGALRIMLISKEATPGWGKAKYHHLCMERVSVSHLF